MRLQAVLLDFTQNRDNQFADTYFHKEMLSHKYLAVKPGLAI